MWRKVYVGPFSQEEAEMMAAGLRTDSNKRAGILAATVRKRGARASEPGYDVYIKCK